MTPLTDPLLSPGTPIAHAQLRSRLIAALRDNHSRGAAKLVQLLLHCGRVGLVAVLVGFDGPVPAAQAVQVLDAAAQR